MSCFARAADGTAYSLDVDLTQGDRLNAYVCKVVVSDLETGEVLSSPVVSFLADSAATVTTGSAERGERTLEFTIFVDSKLSRATADLKVMRNGAILSAQKTSMTVH